MRKRRGAAILLMLMLAAALFLMLAGTLQSYYQLQKQNFHAQVRLQERANALRIQRPTE